MNFELYRIFVVVAKEKNITNASKVLNISQPAVTKHVQNLECYLEIKLFNRTRYGMELTQKGEELYEEVKDAIDLLSQVEFKMKERRTINLGAHSTLLSKLFHNTISEFYQLNLGSEINIINENSDQMMEKLKKKELDILLSKKLKEDLSKEITFLSLGFLHDIFIINKNSDVKEKCLSISDMKKEIIYTPRKTSVTTQNFMKQFGFHPEDEVKNIRNIKYSMILEMIKKGDGIGIITKEYIEDELKKEEISILNTNFQMKPIEFGIYINRNNKFHELECLVKIIQKEFSAS